MISRLTSMNRWVLTALICLFIFAVLATIKFFQIRAAIAFGESFPEPSESVETVTASPSNWQPYISLSASVRASRDVVLRTEVDGVIENVTFESGGSVEEGAVILKLDASEEEARRKATLAEIQFAQKDAKRIQGLSNQGAISRQQQDQIQTRLSVANAELANIDEAIANKKVIAPFSGQAGIHDFEIGEFLRSGTIVTRLVGDLDRLWLDFALPQQYANVPVGTQIVITRANQPALSANLTAIEPAISAESRTVRARAELIDPERQIKPGSFVKITVPVGAALPAYRVPGPAIRKDELGDFVFLLEKDDKNAWRAVRRPVSVARIEGDVAIIESGLSDDELVATTGSFKLKAGTLVNITRTAEMPPEPSALTTPILETSDLDEAVAESDIVTEPEVESSGDEAEEPVPTVEASTEEAANDE